MKLFLLCICCGLTAGSTAHAYLGDDTETLAKRYGKPVAGSSLKDGSQPLTYNKDGYRIRVEFENGRSIRETLTTVDAHLAFSEEALSAFLNAQADGKQWNETEQTPGQRHWRREGARALYHEPSAGQPRLVISKASQVPGEDYFTRLFTASVLTPLNQAMKAADGGDASAPSTTAAPDAAASAKTPATDSADLAASLASDDEDVDLTSSPLASGQLSTGKLQTGKLQTGHLQTGHLQTGPTVAHPPTP